MPLPFVYSSNSLFGQAVTRFKGVILSGIWAPSTSWVGVSSGGGNSAGGVALIQPMAAVTTGASYVTGVQTVSTLSTASGASIGLSYANFIYIPQTTGAIATSSFASGDSAPPLSGYGAALIWDAGNRRLGVYSTAGGSGTWFFSHTGITTSAGAAGFTSS